MNLQIVIYLPVQYKKAPDNDNSTIETWSKNTMVVNYLTLAGPKALTVRLGMGLYPDVTAPGIVIIIINVIKKINTGHNKQIIT